MDFDEIIRNAIKLDELFTRNYYSEDYENNNYEEFSYEEVGVDYEEFYKYIREYYLQKYGKEVEFSFVKVNKALGNSLFIKLIPDYIPCVVLKDYYDGKFYTILIDENDKDYMYYFNNTKSICR